MRIISGKFRGRRLATIRSGVRPTSDRLRESLFDILGERVVDSVWLDAFAGSGAVGLEALSRGARHVVFNDRDPQSLILLRKNIEKCRVARGYEVQRLDVFVLLRDLQTDPFDFIYLDPPYAFGRWEKLLQKAAESRLVGPETWLFLELFKKTRVEQIPPSWLPLRVLEAGDNHLHIYKKRPREQSQSLTPSGKS